MTAPGYDGSITIDTSVDSSGLNAGLSGISGTLSKIAGVLGVAFSVKAIVDFGKKAIDLASNLQIMTNRFSALFGGLAETVKAKLGIISAATNFNEDELMGYAATLENTFRAIGFSATDAAAKSVDTVKLAQDLATFYNTDTASVINTISMSMMGYTRQLREYGISIDENTIKAKAQAMGLLDANGAMSQQAKSAAILQLIIDKTSVAQGNAANSTHTWAGELRGITSTWEKFTENIGTGLITALQSFLPAIQWLLDILTRAAVIFSQLMSILFGMRVQVGGAASGLNAAADAAGNLGDQTTAAGKAAKGALASFDQLNVLQQAGGGAAPISAVSPASGLTVDFKQSVGELQQIWTIFYAWFQNQPIFKVLIDWWNTLYELVLAGIDALQGNWSGAWQHILLAAQSFGLMMVAAWQMVKGNWGAAGAFFNTVWAGIVSLAHAVWFGSPGVVEFFTMGWAAIKFIWDQVGAFFNGLWAGIVTGTTTAWTSLIGIAGTVWNSIAAVIKGVVNIIIGLINGMVAAVVSGMNSVIGALNSIHVSIPAWVPGFGGDSFGISIAKISAPQIPRLATGAVIPPNAAFAAILGDQSSGKNIEAPEELIRRIVREETAGQTVTINFANNNLSALMRVLKPYADKEAIRVGTSFIKTGATS